MPSLIKSVLAASLGFIVVCLLGGLLVVLLLRISHEGPGCMGMQELRVGRIHTAITLAVLLGTLFLGMLYHLVSKGMDAWFRRKSRQRPAKK